MVTLFDLLVQVCGLSQREAAEVLRVRVDTVKSWVSGRRQASQEVLDELAALAARIEMAAVEALAQIENAATQHGAPSEIELGVASDDIEAKTLGWPCVGAQQACLGLVVARGTKRGYRFRVVPRGSTVATAAAADVHERGRTGG
ncbi:MAG: helix-turn-helix transcriptional regulator [Magnetospirillum sp.]|nr:helix-turn-helix transcriptional regulator [Magnetospirillum sp.]